MKKILYNLKTSDKIVFLFSFFNFVWLLILLFAINVVYFFLWYSDQKQESLYDMNINYNKILKTNSSSLINKNVFNQDKNINQDINIKAFKKYILQKNTIIIQNNWEEIICSLWFAKKIHNNMELLDKIKNSLFYVDDSRIFFIYSKKYPEIWEVKVLFDTTPYVKSQIIIIKISLFIIFISLFIFYFLWKKITKYSFRNLEKIARKAGELDIENDFKKLKIVWNKKDEINILASTINESFCHIKSQTSNLKQFITDVSHEFKTPLMVINSKIDLYNKKLEKNKLDKLDTQNLLENIKEKTKKLDNLLETFLLLSRVESSIENLDKTKINFSNYLEGFSHEYIENSEIRKIIWKENIELKYKIEKNIFLKIKKNIFNILFWNLISNAIKFSKNNLKNNKKIKLEIWLNKKSFWIIDNWIWIKKEDLWNIWNKFFRSDRNLEWFGVGLFLVKRLSDLYFWEIDVESKQNKETKFIINYKK